MQIIFIKIRLYNIKMHCTPLESLAYVVLNQTSPQTPNTRAHVGDTPATPIGCFSAA